VDENDRKPAGLETLDTLRPAMSRAIIDDSQHACRRAIGFLTHYISDQTMKGLNAILENTTAENVGAARLSTTGAYYLNKSSRWPRMLHRR
jgi:hypothetical protein